MSISRTFEDLNFSSSLLVTATSSSSGASATLALFVLLYLGTQVLVHSHERQSKLKTDVQMKPRGVWSPRSQIHSCWDCAHEELCGWNLTQAWSVTISWKQPKWSRLSIWQLFCFSYFHSFHRVYFSFQLVNWGILWRTSKIGHLMERNSVQSEISIHSGRCHRWTIWREVQWFFVLLDFLCAVIELKVSM